MLSKEVAFLSLSLLLSFTNAYSKIEEINFKIIKILLTKYNLRHISYIYSNSSRDNKLIEMLFHDFPSPLTISNLEIIRKIPFYAANTLVLIVSDFEGHLNSNIEEKDLSINIPVYVIISDKQWHQIPKGMQQRASLLLNQKLIYGKKLCGSNNVVPIEFEDFNEFDLILMSYCKYAIHEHAYFNADHPLVVRMYGGKVTGKLYYFSEGLLEYVYKLILKYKNSSNNSGTIKFDSFLITILLMINNFDNAKTCFMVPKLRLLPQELYISHMYEDLAWLTIFVATFYIALGYKFIFKGSYFQGLQFTIGIVTWTSWISIPRYQNMKQLIVFVLLTLYGFWLTNVYLAHLSTYLTSDVYGKQIETVEDILRTNLKIMIKNDARNIAIKNGLKSAIVEKDVATLSRHLFRFNTSYGYLVTKHTWEHLERMQELLSKKKFHYTNICDYSDLLTVLIIKGLWNPIFRTHFYMYPFRVMEGGLLEIWNTLSHHDMYKGRLFRYLREDHNARKPLSLSFFLKMWYHLIFGWTFGLVIIFLEISIHIYNKFIPF